MSSATTTGTTGSSGSKKARTPTVRSVEAPRWTSLQGRLTPTQRRAALRQVASKMR
ncbi:hypothetical protein [Nocardioides plantarum]|uniref:Uncharacterized protein n=1 Tax=Nocardioides plantarum TaxID=29299 RepID=A0ABV5KEF8_9ACTN|nr:hypothetical protein [Nocardioides plantarum]